MKPDVKKYEGCLIGQCLGDALGFPVEGYPLRLCQQYIDKAINTHQILEFQPENSHPFAQYTDDSQLARELIESYVEHQQFLPEEYAKRIARIFAEKRIVGRGRATQMAAEKLQQGIHWTEAATPAPSAGNGSAMRSAPVALFFYDNIDHLILAAKQQGSITHSDPRCVAGSVIIAGVTALVLTSDEIEPSHILTKVGGWIADIDSAFADILKSFGEWMALPPQQACDHIVGVYLPEDHREVWDRISPYVVPSTLWSLYSFFKYPHSYMDTIKCSIMMGGDVDTTAAMAGAISGAYLGVDAIPQNYAQLLTDQGTWNYSDLMNLAQKCYRVKHSE
ncbi:ADP-ribosylglycohydrolase family protein [Candidatus Uabimicrobium amorphum]|uniref:Ribosylglycohydrolase n=1 Tax=Uabimicrobium amorphum TaxID=2596890 RepID=A0A5S9ISD5_UABAM|nr:ADP-ribosylglycohydrolase family protein [Candidatus Uabimicrobium amorphum]BBM87268.1 ribosylglycohydrolase [Candidatus Uabimicrobium amorphum]